MLFTNIISELLKLFYCHSIATLCLNKPINKPIISPPAKGVGRVTGARVQIPCPPLKQKPH